MPRKRKHIIKIDNIESLQSLMQEVYNDACSQIQEAQNVINGFSNGVEVVDTDDYAKVAKAKTDALKIKEAAIKIKLDVGRLQNDVIKNHGELPEELTKTEISGGATLDHFSKLRKMIEDGKNKGSES